MARQIDNHVFLPGGIIDFSIDSLVNNLLLFPSAIAGLAVGQPFIEDAVGNAIQLNIEAFYNYPVNDNNRITLLVQVITNPANQNSNGTIVTETLRTIFSLLVQVITNPANQNSNGTMSRKR